MFRPFKSNDVSILYVDRGELTVKYDLKTYTLREGMAILKGPSVIHQVISISEDCHFRIFGFLQQRLATTTIPVNHLEALALTVEKDPVLSLDASGAASTNALFSWFEEKGKLTVKPPLYNESLGHAFGLLLLEMATLFNGKKLIGPASITRKEHLAFEFLKLLRQHIKEQRSVAFYASILHVTPKYLSKSVKEVTGKTCGEMIDEMVVIEAKALLNDTSLTIGQVADELHFSDQFFFSKYFKKQTGISPFSYRTAV
jgi:AraC-like DNA-binding protein